MSFCVAKCPTCGASLEFDKPSDVMVCKYCGNKIVIKESLGGDINNASKFLELANNEMELGNYQKATDYFNKVLEANPQNPAAHFGKGVSNSKQYSLEDFKFKELLTGYSNAQKYISENGKKEFISSVIDLLYKHGTNCENLLHDRFIHGVDDKDLTFFVMKSFEIIRFYEAVSRINESDVRSPKKIVEITKSLSLGVKGKGNRYDNNCNLVRDWRYELKPELIKKIKTIQTDNVQAIKKIEPEFVLESEKEETVMHEPKKIGFFDKFRY